MLRRSHTRCTTRRNSVSLEVSLAPYSTVPTPNHSPAYHSPLLFILGIVIALFFQCMAPLFNRTNRSTKWALVAHTTVMFSLATVFIAVELNILSISYIDNREFPGVDRVFPPGPLGYRSLIYSEPINLVPGIMFLLNSWLADGLLVHFSFDSFARASNNIQLYRCYIIYSMNRWAVSLPCLLYLASLG